MSNFYEAVDAVLNKGEAWACCDPRDELPDGDWALIRIWDPVCHGWRLAYASQNAESDDRTEIQYTILLEYLEPRSCWKKISE